MSASQIFHKTHHTQLYKKEEYRHLHGAVREYVNLKEKLQVSNVTSGPAVDDALLILNWR